MIDTGKNISPIKRWGIYMTLNGFKVEYFNNFSHAFVTPRDAGPLPSFSLVANERHNAKQCNQAIDGMDSRRRIAHWSVT